MSTPAPPSAAESLPEEPQESVHASEYLYLLVRRYKVAVAVLLVVAAGGTVRTLLTRPVYQGAVDILIERNDPNVLNFKEVAGADAGFGSEYYQTQYQLLGSRALARRAVTNLNLLQDPEFGGPRAPEAVDAALKAAEGQSPLMEGVISQFQSRLRVVPVRNSRIVTVTFEAYRPKLAADGANSLSEAYIQQSLDFRYQTSADAGVWLTKQIQEQRTRVEQAEAALERHKQQAGIVNIEERRSLLQQRLRELGSALTSAKTERLEKEALHREMTSAANPDELLLVRQDPLVQAVRIEMAQLERKRAELLQSYTDRHPEVVRLTTEIQDMGQRVRLESQRIVNAARNDYEAALSQENSLARELEAAKDETQQLSAGSVQYDTLKREVEAGKAVLDSLLSRLKETDVAQELQSSNIRIVDRAVTPRSPVRPKTGRDILFSILFGAVLAIGAAFLAEYLDNTVKGPEDVRRRLGAPLLGVIAEVDPKEKPLLDQGSDALSGFAEGFRVVRTSLHYSWSDRASRVVLVTSTIPEEGKTLTSCNLALTLAATGAKVLLVDADLRRPQVHRLLSYPRKPGLADLLTGRTAPSKTIQVSGDGRPHVLTAGTSVPSPPDLLGGTTLSALLDGLRRTYDWVVIDSPPVSVVAEPMILAPLCDGAIVVAASEMVPWRAALHTLQRLADAGTRILGVILNRAQLQKRGYYHSHYYAHYYGRYYGRYHRRPSDHSKIARMIR